MKAVWLLVLAAVACGSGDPSGPPTRIQLTAAFVAGDSQINMVGALLPNELVAYASDKATGSPVTNVVINFVVTAGDGSVFAPAVLVDGAGMARNRWTLGPLVGIQRVEARAINQNGEAVTYDTAVAIATPGLAVEVKRTHYPLDGYGNERLILCPIATSCYDPVSGIDGDSARVSYWYLDSYGNTTTSCSGSEAPTLFHDVAGALSITGPFTSQDGKKYFLFKNIATNSPPAFWVWWTFNCYGVVQDSFLVQTN